VSHAGEWGSAGIRVNCIAPGPIDTEGAAPRVWPNPKVKEMVARSRALQRFGRVEENRLPMHLPRLGRVQLRHRLLLIIDGGGRHDAPGRVSGQTARQVDNKTVQQ